MTFKAPSFEMNLGKFFDDFGLKSEKTINAWAWDISHTKRVGLGKMHTLVRTFLPLQFEGPELLHGDTMENIMEDIELFCKNTRIIKTHNYAEGKPPFTKWLILRRP